MVKQLHHWFARVSGMREFSKNYFLLSSSILLNIYVFDPLELPMGGLYFALFRVDLDEFGVALNILGNVLRTR